MQEETSDSALTRCVKQVEMKPIIRNIANTLCISVIMTPFSKNMCNISRTCYAHKYIIPWYYMLVSFYTKFLLIAIEACNPM